MNLRKKTYNDLLAMERNYEEFMFAAMECGEDNVDKINAEIAKANLSKVRQEINSRERS